MLFDSTLRRDLARSFGATLVVILTIVITMMLIRTLGLAAGGAVAPQDVVLLLGYTALGHLPTMLSLSLFVAIVVTLGPHVPRQRDGDLVRQRRGPGALRAAGAAHELAGAAGGGAAAAVRLALGQPQQHRTARPLRAALRPVARGARACSRARATAAACSSSNATAATSVSARNVFILSSQRRRRTRDLGAQRPHRAARATTASWCSSAASATTSTPPAARRTLSSFESYRVLAGDTALRARPRACRPRRMATLDLLRAARRRATRASWPGASACCWRRPTCCCWASAWRPPTRAAPATGTCCSRCWPSSSTSTSINLTQAWVASGRFGMGAALLALHGGVFAAGAGAAVVARPCARCCSLRPRAPARRRPA